MLDAEGIRAGYGAGPDVLHGASIHVADGEIVAMIGLNGAGKSTIVRAIAGLLPLRGGQVSIDGVDVSRMPTDQRARRGVVLVPEGRELCSTMTVEENLLLGTVPLARYHRRRKRAENSELVYGLFPILAEKRRDPAGSLSGGQQQMVAVGRALMSSPRLLILDEPSLGLAPLLTREIFEVVKRLNRENGLSVLLVEQNAALAIAYSHRAYHLELGQVSATDSATEQRSLLSVEVGARSAGVNAIALPTYQRMDRRGRKANA